MQLTQSMEGVSSKGTWVGLKSGQEPNVVQQGQVQDVPSLVAYKTRLFGILGLWWRVGDRSYIFLKSFPNQAILSFYEEAMLSSSLSPQEGRVFSLCLDFISESCPKIK